LLCVLGWLLSDGERRRYVVRGHFGVMLAVAVVCMMPVLVWNAKHGWITAQHLHERAALTEGWRVRPGEFFQFLTQQALVISPGYFLLMLAAWVGFAIGRGSGVRGDARLAYCAWMAWPVFFLFAGLAWNESGEANWTVTMLPTGLLLGVVWWGEGDRLKRMKGWIVAAVGLAAVMTVVLHETAPLRLPPKSDPLSRARGWKSLVGQVQAIRERYPGATLVANKYQTVSILSYYLPDRPKIYQPRSSRILNQLSFWGDYDVGRVGEVLFITDDLESLPEVLMVEFKGLEEIGVLRPEPPWEGLRRWRVLRFFNVSM
jgi:hypothetical protein